MKAEAVFYIPDLNINLPSFRIFNWIIKILWCTFT